MLLFSAYIAKFIDSSNSIFIHMFRENESPHPCQVYI